MKLNRFFMLGLVGLAFAACGNEDEAENALAQGNGAVSIKIVSPTANSRAVTSDTPDGTIKVTGPATVSLTATFDGEEKIKTIDLARGETEAKFWNVTNPTLVTVSMNDGTKVYTTSINDVTMQVTESIPAYGETKDFTYNNRTGTPTLEDITNGDNTGAKDGDTDKTFFMYEATVDLKIPVARLEVSNIKHKKEVESVKCEYATLTIDGVYMDNIRPTGTGDLTDYKFPGDNGGTASGTDAILFDAIPAEGNANNFMDYDLSWPAADEDGKAQVFAYNFYAPETGDDTSVNPIFKIYFKTATPSNTGEIMATPRYAKIVNYKSEVNGAPIVLLAGHVYRITDVQLEDKNISGGEGGDELWGVTVTVREAAWQVETTYADWAE